MSKRLIVKVQTPLAGNAAVPVAMIYDQTREVHDLLTREECPVWDEVVAAGGKAFYLARYAGGKIKLLHRVDDKAW